MILRLMPFLLLIAYGFLMMRFSVWRSKRMLDQQSRPLDDPEIKAVAARLAAALDLQLQFTLHDGELQAALGPIPTL